MKSSKVVVQLKKNLTTLNLKVFSAEKNVEFL